MSSPGTVPTPTARMPVRSLHVEVVEGPDAGRAVAARSDALAIGTAQGNDLVLTDPTVSRYHVALERRDDGIWVTDHGSTNGTSVGPVRIRQASVAPGTLLRIGRTTARVGEGPDVAVEIHPGEGLAGLRGRSPQMRRLMAELARAARAETSVLVVGESGTGKELIAKALHDLGARASRAFVTVDCGALAPTLVTGELFGHERGSFTGADRLHQGAFERADGGTLFLDEIGELPLAQQAALLGVLERRRFRRVGGAADIAVDVRVVAATNRDLRAQVNDSTFRLDLYYRLAVVVLRVAPLRERREDVPLLVEHFLRECGHDAPAEAVFPPATMAALQAHSWPGNVRELRNLVEATVAMGAAPLGGLLPSPASTSASVPPDAGPAEVPPYKLARAAVLQRFEEQYLRQLLDGSGGNVTQAARTAQMDRSHLIDLLRRHQLR